MARPVAPGPLEMAAFDAHMSGDAASLSKVHAAMQEANAALVASEAPGTRPYRIQVLALRHCFALPLPRTALISVSHFQVTVTHTFSCKHPDRRLHPASAVLHRGPQRVAPTIAVDTVDASGAPYWVSMAT